MRKLGHHRDTTEYGFTLVELLVGMSIIAILVAIAVPLYLNQKKKAIMAGLKSETENAAMQWQRDYYDSLRSWDTGFITGLNTANSTGVLTGYVYDEGTLAEDACVESKSRTTDQDYSFVISTQQGDTTPCSAP